MDIAKSSKGSTRSNILRILMMLSAIVLVISQFSLLTYLFLMHSGRIDSKRVPLIMQQIFTYSLLATGVIAFMMWAEKIRDIGRMTWTKILNKPCNYVKMNKNLYYAVSFLFIGSLSGMACIGRFCEIIAIITICSVCLLIVMTILLLILGLTTKMRNRI
jgi:hypothetical protein